MNEVYITFTSFFHMSRHNDVIALKVRQEIENDNLEKYYVAQLMDEGDRVTLGPEPHLAIPFSLF